MQTSPHPNSKVANLRWPALGIGGGWLLTLLIGWPSLAYPLGRDNGIFAYTGWAVLHGQVPYINFWEHKTPLIFFIYAAMMKLFGATEAGVRVGDLAYTLLVIPFVYLIVHNLFGRRAAGCAALSWAVFHTAVNTLYFWSGAESETFMVLPLILASYSYRRAEADEPNTGRIGWGWMIATGLFAGVAVMIKITALVGLMGLAIYALFGRQRGGEWRGWVRSLAIKLGLGLVGLGLAIGPFVLYFALNHALAEAIDVSIVANIAYGGAGVGLVDAGLDLLGKAGGDLLGLRFYYLLPAIALVYIALKERTRATALVCLWLAATFAMTWIQGRLWPYHFIGTLVPLSILCGFIIDRGLREWQAWANRREGRAMTVSEGSEDGINHAPTVAGQPAGRSLILTGYVIVGGLLVALAGWSLWKGNGTETVYSWERYVQYQSGQISQRDYYADFHRGTYDYLPNRDAGEYIRAHTQSGDRVLVWAVDPLVNFIADRFAPGRFIYNYPIVAEEVPVAARDRYKQIFMDEFNRNPPAMIAVAEGDTSPITPVDSLGLKPTFPAFDTALTNQYHFVLEIPISPNKGETFLIYERNK